MVELIRDFEVLREGSEPLRFISETGLEQDEGQNIIAKLVEAMDENPELVTLTAPEIGERKRIFGMRFSDDIRIFIDPIITKKTDYSIGIETSSLLPGKEILVTRPNELTVVYHTKEFKYEENKFLGVGARFFDAAVQLLDGVLPSDLGLVSDIETDGSLTDLTEEDFTMVLEIYKNYIQTLTKATGQTVSEDPTLSAQFKQLNFAERVITGTAAIVAENDPVITKAKAKAQAAVALQNKKYVEQEKSHNTTQLKQFISKKGKNRKRQ